MHAVLVLAEAARLEGMFSQVKDSKEMYNIVDSDLLLEMLFQYIERMYIT
jgi:hypothetical protein